MPEWASRHRYGVATPFGRGYFFRILAPSIAKLRQGWNMSELRRFPGPKRLSQAAVHFAKEASTKWLTIERTNL